MRWSEQSVEAEQRSGRFPAIARRRFAPSHPRGAGQAFVRGARQGARRAAPRAVRWEQPVLPRHAAPCPTAAAGAHRIHSGRVRRGAPRPGSDSARRPRHLLAVGPGPYLSRWSAAHGGRLVRRRPATVSSSGTAPHSGISGDHRFLTDRGWKHVRLKDGLGVTAPMRTLLDLAGSRPRVCSSAAVAESQATRGVGHDELAAYVRGAGDDTARPDLGAVLPRRRTRADTIGGRRRLLALIRSAGLRAPKVNARLAGWEVDFVWVAAAPRRRGRRVRVPQLAGGVRARSPQVADAEEARATSRSA